MQEIGENDIGTVITLESNISLAAFSEGTIKYKKSDKTTGEWTATISGNNLQYTTVLSDIDVHGLWVLQGYAKSSTWQGVSNHVQIKVIEDLT